MKTSLSLILATIIFGYSLSVSAAPVCNQTFEGTLRVGLGYTFGDMYTNTDGFRHNIAGGNVTIDESSAGDLNRAGGPGFTWTQQLLAQDYEIAPGQTIQALSADTPYYVYDYPISRDNKLLVIYSLDVQAQNDDGSWTRPPITHNECKSYTVTRCGDGVIDPGYETCDPAAPGQSPASCDVATCQPITTPPTPVVSIKKYVKTLNAAGDTQTAPVSIARGEAFNYYYQLQNTGSVAATGVVVKDTLPSYLTYSGTIRVTDPAGTDVTADWTTLTGSTVFVGETLPRIWLVLSKKTDLPANSGLYTFTIPVVLATTAPVFVNMQNVVYACAANVVANPTGPNGEVICGNVNPPPPPPPAQCDQTNPNSQKDPACIVVTGSGFDLSLKKYIGTNDAQTAALGVSTTTTAVLSYVIRVTNSGPESSSGVTTVQDILPTGVVLDGTVSGTSWTCSTTSVMITCTSTLIVGSGSTYPDITIPFRVTATAGQSVTNIAAVDNPLEENRCMTTTSLLPTTSSTYCTRDTLNSDPAVLTVSGGPTGGSSNIGKKCINGIASCASYNTLAACIADGIPAALCYPADAVGQNMCTAQPLSCSGPGGGGGGSYVGGYCGDGVLGSSPGEECDVVGAPWCVACKIDLKTNPGANPITDLWMTIPVLTGTQRIGYTWLDGVPGKVAFADNRIVLGVGTKAFTLVDTVGFGIRTQYHIPLIIEANKKICLKSEGSSLNSQDICTTFGEAANSSPEIQTWQRADGVRFVNIGVGDYQKINPIPQPPMPSQLPLIHTASQQAEYDAAVQAYIDWRQYIPVYSSSANNITFFRGPVQYSSLQNNNIGPTLNSAFFGMIPGNNSTIGLFTDTGVDLVKLAVRVSGAVVSTIGSSSNRAIESFINTRDIFAGFLGTTIGYTSTTSNNTSTTTTVTLPTLVGAAGTTISSVADLEQRYAVNGNKNILAVTGDLTITCPAGSTVFTMTGVRTVIVTGNLIIRCNIVYGSSDSTSSWAWIAKNGNIQVYNGTGAPNVGAVTNLMGVYVAVKETTGGDITYTGANTTQAILRVEGTLYGNASPLFASRLYARATGAYDILTTGTILTYSNRALVSPPPLLSQYLGTYQVQRVVQ